MNIEIIKTPKGTYKIISHSSHKHPALVQLAELLKYTNMSNKVKIGIYNVFGERFSNKVSVYSYIAKRSERLTKKQYNSFVAGKRHIKGGDKISKEIILPEFSAEEIFFNIEENHENK